AGTMGDFGAYSFHEVKNITSFGEGGIAVSNVLGFKDHMKRARFFGVDNDYQIKDWIYDVRTIPGKEKPFVAVNYSTTEIQALGLSLQIARIEEIIAARRKAAEYLNSRLAGNPALICQDLGNDEIKPTFHLYQLQVVPEIAGGDVQVLKRKLGEKGVTTIPHFGPLYRFQATQQMGYDADEIAKTCPVCEEVFHHRFTHLPLYGLTEEQFEYMADAILESIDEMQKGL
ncbi:MAG: DegT/DnrJ/EryC1/StrS family aminotransferase, partial [Clostridia bacterium]|nr:DegT/DnrJ/EryC1/StrS family aminotransferase [Clostridia bacterium]